ncbi:MAG: glycosyltransferase family 29 protein [Celeribacter marinus]
MFWLFRKWMTDAQLARGTLHPSELHDLLRGKTIAIVGNARALSHGAFGQEIDAADIVIRINRAPCPAEISHGMRTDWLATSIPLQASVLNAHDPSLILWMTSKRKRLPKRFLKRGLGFYLNRKDDRSALAARMNSAPTTGAMLIDLIAKSPAAQIDLYGFDFFSSLSLSGRRTADDVPHDFDAEALFVNGLCADDERITLHSMK